MDMGDYSKAYDYVQKAITISEANPKLALPSEKAVFYSNLAYIYIKQGIIVFDSANTCCSLSCSFHVVIETMKPLIHYIKNCWYIL